MFEDLWNYITDRCLNLNFPLVQNKQELEYIFNLMKDCKSYLEVGSAEGNSLYVLANAMPKGSHITYIDKDEDRTRPKRNSVISALGDYDIYPIHGDSHDQESIIRTRHRRYDAVLIDAGHSYDDAIQDARNYAPLAEKYVFFHDVQLPEVKRAFEEYKNETGLSGYTIINSEKFGYGILTK